MRTPKEAFLQSGMAKQFMSCVGNPAFDIACEYALLQLQSEMLPNILPGKPVDPYLGLDCNAQIHGASRVLAILHSIADPVEVKEPPKRRTLNYDNATNRSTTSTDADEKR